MTLPNFLAFVALCKDFFLRSLLIVVLLIVYSVRLAFSKSCELSNFLNRLSTLFILEIPAFIFLILNIGGYFVSSFSKIRSNIRSMLFSTYFWRNIFLSLQISSTLCDEVVRHLPPYRSTGST